MRVIGPIMLPLQLIEKSLDESIGKKIIISLVECAEFGGGSRDSLRRIRAVSSPRFHRVAIKLT